VDKKAEIADLKRQVAERDERIENLECENTEIYDELEVLKAEHGKYESTIRPIYEKRFETGKL
jgi:predicted nuclease with TOPRIM domain